MSRRFFNNVGCQQFAKKSCQLRVRRFWRFLWQSTRFTVVIETDLLLTHARTHSLFIAGRERPDGTVLTADCTTQRPAGVWPRILRWFGVRQPPASPPQPSAPQASVPQAERRAFMGHLVRERDLPVVVLCAAKTILANEQITPDAIQSTTIRRCDSVENMAERVEEVCGRRTRKTIRRGEKILLADLVQAEEAEVDQSC